MVLFFLKNIANVFHFPYRLNVVFTHFYTILDKSSYRFSYKAENIQTHNDDKYRSHSSEEFQAVWKHEKHHYVNAEHNANFIGTLIQISFHLLVWGLKANVQESR